MTDDVLVTTLLAVSFFSIPALFFAAVLIRVFQYKNYAGGKFVKSHLLKSVVSEFCYMALFMVVVLALGLVATKINSMPTVWLLVGLVLVIAGLQLYRVAAMLVRGIMPQAIRFGIDKCRTSDSTPTGPVRIGNVLQKLEFVDQNVD